MDVVDPWWSEIEHLTTTGDIVFHHELMFSTLAEMCQASVRWEFQRRIASHQPTVAELRTTLKRLDAKRPDNDRSGI